MRTGRRLRARSIPTALLAAICLLLATPLRASAEEESDNLWIQWWRGVTDRSLKAEIPIAFVVTLPAMLVVTPVWLAGLAYERLSSEEDDS